jgi:hypothetical protein
MQNSISHPTTSYKYATHPLCSHAKRKRLYISRRKYFRFWRSSSSTLLAETLPPPSVVGGDVMGISSKAGPPPTNSHAMTSLSSYSARSEMYTHRNYITLSLPVLLLWVCAFTFTSQSIYTSALTYTTVERSPPMWWCARAAVFWPNLIAVRTIRQHFNVSAAEYICEY